MRSLFSTYSLAQWTALADGDLVTLLNTESWRNVRSEVLVALLVTGVLWDEVEVLAADDEGSVHLGGDDGSGEDTATDGDLAGEWALLVCEKRDVSIYACQTFLPTVLVRSRELEARVWIGHAPRRPSPQRVSSSSSLRISRFLRSLRSRNMRPRHTNVVALNGGLWGLETQTNVLVPSATSLAGSRSLDLDLGVEEDVRLLLESALGLDGQFGSHFCGWWMSRLSVGEVVRIGSSSLNWSIHGFCCKRSL